MFVLGRVTGTAAEAYLETGRLALARKCLERWEGSGQGWLAVEYDVERKFRETRLYQVAPISTNLILSNIATHVLGLPKSF